MNRGIRTSKSKELIPSGYQDLLDDLKERIRGGRIKAAISVNRELIILYWNIGKRILEKQKEEGWGSKVINRLSKDLMKEFPKMKGFSVRNLKYMRRFAQEYSDEEKVQQLAAQIPWFHNCVLMDKVKDANEREYYIKKTIEHGWSRNVLVHQIEIGLFHRKGKALTNFPSTLPRPESDLAQELIKDPYNFDFLTIADKYHEVS